MENKDFKNLVESARKLLSGESKEECLKEHLWFAPNSDMHRLYHAFEDAWEAYLACKTQTCRNEWLQTLNEIAQLYIDAGGSIQDLPHQPKPPPEDIDHVPWHPENPSRDPEGPWLADTGESVLNRKEECLNEHDGGFWEHILMDTQTKAEHMVWHQIMAARQIYIECMQSGSDPAVCLAAYLKTMNALIKELLALGVKYPTDGLPPWTIPKPTGGQSYWPWILPRWPWFGLEAPDGKNGRGGEGVDV